MNIWEYEGKWVRIDCQDGDVFVGKVGDYVWEDDNEEYGCDAIFLFVDGNYHDTIQINSTDIKSIEVLE